MKLVLQTSLYWPRTGGIETVARLLAEEFAALGHSPVVLTDTPGPTVPAVLRQAPLARRAAAVRAADAVLMFGLSLRFMPLPVLLRRPTVVSHHTWYGRGAAAALKRGLSRFTRNIAVSNAIARALGAAATVIPNPYDDRLFFRRDAVERTRDVVFVGRLVSDKGLALLLEALAQLSLSGRRLTLTVVGTGPEEGRCRQVAAASGIQAQIEWSGGLQGEALAVALNGHRVIAVPSLWQEPFGVVALEGMACGCTVVGSIGGGLPQTIGPGGRTFANGDVAALAGTLLDALEAGESAVPAAVAAHLQRHSRRAVALRYLEVLQSVGRSL